jgi:hypothetical protein
VLFAYRQTSKKRRILNDVLKSQEKVYSTDFNPKAIACLADKVSWMVLWQKLQIASQVSTERKYVSLFIPENL